MCGLLLFAVLSNGFMTLVIRLCKNSRFIPIRGTKMQLFFLFLIFEFYFIELNLLYGHIWGLYCILTWLFYLLLNKYRRILLNIMKPINTISDWFIQACFFMGHPWRIMVRWFKARQYDLVLIIHFCFVFIKYFISF